MFPPGLEPGTFRVLGERDNHYTTETVKNTSVIFKWYHKNLILYLNININDNFSFNLR